MYIIIKAIYPRCPRMGSGDVHQIPVEFGTHRLRAAAVVEVAHHFLVSPRIKVSLNRASPALTLVGGIALGATMFPLTTPRCKDDPTLQKGCKAVAMQGPLLWDQWVSNIFTT